MPRYDYSLRLSWALLASLLLHLMLIGNLANPEWWRPFTATGTPSALDVQLLPPAASQHSDRGSAPTVPVPLPQTVAPADSHEEMADLPPIPESYTATIAETPQDLTADLQAGPPAVKLEETRIEQRLPLNGKLIYRFYWGKSRWLAGEAIHQWLIEKDNYSLTSTIRTTGLFQLFHPLRLVETSRGKISGETLQPQQFFTQLNDYPAAVTMFNWDKRLYRWFRGQDSFTQALPKNSYDKISYLYQLYLASRQESYFSVEITMGRRLEHYDILDLGTEEVDIDGRIHQAIHLRRATTMPEMENVDIWLASDMNHLPLKMTYANQAGDHFEQLIEASSLAIH